jgi:hypothetical protein
MSGLERVMEELYPGYSKRKEKAKAKTERKKAEEDKTMENDYKESAEEQVVKPDAEPPRRKRRVMKPRKATEHKTEGLLSNNMYTLSIVGTIGMEGYNLNPGEKLVIAKLTPIPITK